MAPRGGVVGSAAMLGLDMRLAPQQMHPAAAFQHQQQSGFQLQQPAPVSVRQQQQQQAPPSSFSPYSNTSSSRGVVSAAVDDDMVGNGGGKVQQQQQPQMASAAACPWTRMKWTDAMVRLLIGVVHSVGDDGEGVATASGGKAGRAGSSAHGHAAAAQQQQQKKGKWKSVSQAMMDHGFVVSPQQCEDKFNDLNKRYKRVVDLLGRGRACRVVENHALLDTLDGITPKAKDEARKLLSSKHLFFPEMCSYHNNAATGAATAGGGSHMPPHAGGGGGAECLHHPLPPAPVAAAASSAARHALHQAAPSPPGIKDSDDEDEDDDSDDAVSDSDDDEDDSDSDEEDGGGHMYNSNRRPSRQQHSGGRTSGKRGAEDVDDEAEGGGSGRRARRRKKKRRVAPDPSAMLRQLKSELASASASAAMDPQQARAWMRRRAVEVEEQQILLDSHAVYLDRQRLKWEQFRGDKERDMERARLQNDRFRMESRRLLLMLRHKDIDLDMAEANSSSVDHHPGASPSPLAAHQQPVGSSPSPSIAGHPN